MNLREVRALLRLLQEHDLEELEIEEAGQRIRVRRRVAAAPGAPSPLAASPPPPPVTAPEPGVPPAALPPGAPRLSINAPMVGTFYRAPAPNADPFVREGVLVEVGAVVCIIEAMKLMNEIEAEVRGRVVAILVENGQPVEYGQPLFNLEPA